MRFLFFPCACFELLDCTTSACKSVSFVRWCICISTLKKPVHVGFVASTLTVTLTGLPCAPVTAEIPSPLADAAEYQRLQLPSRTGRRDTERKDWCQLVIYSCRHYKYLTPQIYPSLCLQTMYNREGQLWSVIV